MIEVHTNRRRLNSKSMLSVLYCQIYQVVSVFWWVLHPAATAPDDIGGGGLFGPVLMWTQNRIEVLERGALKVTSSH